MPEDYLMAAYDIMLYSSPDEGAGRAAYHTNITAATFQVGEPVLYQAVNGLVDAETGPGGVDPLAITGIALEPAASRGNMMGALEVESGDTLRTIELADPNKVFAARYFATAGTGVHVTPTWATVAGILGNLVHNAAADTWAFDTGAGNLNCEGLDVLDADGFSLGDDLTQSGTGVLVLFRFV